MDLACVVGGVVSSQGDKFFESGVVIFVAVFLHNGLGYSAGIRRRKTDWYEYCKEETHTHRSWNAERGLATNLATTTAQFAVAPNPQLSVQYPVHGILSQEHFSQDICSI